MKQKMKSDQDPRHTFLDVPDLMSRYGRGKTFIYDRVKEPGFPGPVMSGLWRLDHVMAWEDRKGSSLCEERERPKTAKRSTAKKTDEPAVSVLAPRRPGRKSTKKAA